jgi:hypothetical protein
LPVLALLSSTAGGAGEIEPISVISEAISEITVFKIIDTSIKNPLYSNKIKSTL